MKKIILKVRRRLKLIFFSGFQGLFFFFFQFSATSGELDPAIQNVLKSGDHKNTTTAKTLKKRRFLWKIVGFTACSKTCGGGIKSPIIRCVREAPTRIFSPKRCAHMKQPELNEQLLKCNTKPCPAYWKLAEWSECNCGNYDEEVFRTREVKCVQELTSGIVIQVDF
jgi:thrombospondin type-1 domain-containing protein 4